MNSTQLQSRTFDALRFPLAVLVVYIHSKITDAQYTPVWSDFQASDVFTTIQILISSVIGHVAVPAFYVISGYLFFYKLNGSFSKSIYWNKLKKRFHSLFIPYMLWNVLTIGWIVARKLAGVVIKGKPLSEINEWLADNGYWKLFWDCNVWNLTKCNWLGQFTPPTSPILTPLWFLRDLIVVVVLTPLIYAFLRKLKGWGLALLAISYITGIFPYIHGLSITAVFFFSMGAYYSIHQLNIVEQFKKMRTASLALYLPATAIMVYYNSHYTPSGQLLYPFYVILSVVVMFNITSWLLERGYNIEHPVLSRATFFIYAFHGFLALRITGAVLMRVIPQSDTFWSCMLMRYLLTAPMAIAICIAVHHVMKRVCPKVLRVLTGSRE